VPVVKSRAVASNRLAAPLCAHSLQIAKKGKAFRLALMSIHGGKLRWPTRSPQAKIQRLLVAGKTAWFWPTIAAALVTKTVGDRGIATARLPFSCFLLARPMVPGSDERGRVVVESVIS
jgi:hypothetical protein